MMNKTKIILFDVDGVLIRLPYYFSKELENKGYENAVESLNPFFNKGINHKCLEGKADAEKIILPFLKKFGWKGTAKNYLKQQFRFESKYLDKKIITLIKKFRKEGVKCYLCTDQEKNRAKFLLNDAGFKKIFNGYFISCYIGYRKCHDNFWKYVLKELKQKFPSIKPDEIMFFDDTKNNIDTALKFGIQAFLFKDRLQFEKNLTALNLNKIKNPSNK